MNKLESPQQIENVEKIDSDETPKRLIELAGTSFTDKKDVDFLTGVYKKEERTEGEFDNLFRNSLEFVNNYRERIAGEIIDLINLCEYDDIDAVFFLDKSARPYGYLFLKTYQEIYGSDRHPEVKFLNIGAESEQIAHDISAHEALRSKFEGFISGRRILIADEFKDSGATLLRAQHIFENVFPDAKALEYKYISYRQPRWNLMEEKQSIGVKDVDLSKLSEIDSEKYLYGLLVEPGGNFDEAQDLRQEMSKLAKLIAKNIQTTSDARRVRTGHEYSDTPYLDETSFKLALRKPDDFEVLQKLSERNLEQQQ